MFQIPNATERKYKAMLDRYAKRYGERSIAMDRVINDASEHLRLDNLPEDQHEVGERFDVDNHIQPEVVSCLKR